MTQMRMTLRRGYRKERKNYEAKSHGTKKMKKEVQRGARKARPPGCVVCSGKRRKKDEHANLSTYTDVKARRGN